MYAQERVGGWQPNFLLRPTRGDEGCQHSTLGWRDAVSLCDEVCMTAINVFYIYGEGRRGSSTFSFDDR